MVIVASDEGKYFCVAGAVPDNSYERAQAQYDRYRQGHFCYPNKL